MGFTIEREPEETPAPHPSHTLRRTVLLLSARETEFRGDKVLVSEEGREDKRVFAICELEGEPSYENEIEDALGVPWMLHTPDPYCGEAMPLLLKVSDSLDVDLGEREVEEEMYHWSVRGEIDGTFTVRLAREGEVPYDDVAQVVATLIALH